jgi:hypothetical protein
VDKTAATNLRDNTFYATIWVRVGDRSHEVDARPSNAFNLALRVKALIYVAPEVFERRQLAVSLHHRTGRSAHASSSACNFFCTRSRRIRAYLRTVTALASGQMRRRPFDEC